MIINCRTLPTLAKTISTPVSEPGLKMLLGKVLTFNSGTRVATVDINGNGTTDYTVNVVCPESPVVGNGLWIMDMGNGKWIGTFCQPSLGITSGGATSLTIPFSMGGFVYAASSTRYEMKTNGTAVEILGLLGTAGTSGTTIFLWKNTSTAIGTVTIASGSIRQASTISHALVIGDVLHAQVTSAGTNAVRLTVEVSVSA